MAPEPGDRAPAVVDTEPQAPVVPEPAVPAPADTPPQLAEDAAFVAARNRLVQAIASPDLDVEVGPPTLTLTPPCVLDIEDGSGHGGSLAFHRLEVGPATTRCERVTWQAYREKPTEIGGTASRAEVATQKIVPLLDAVAWTPVPDTDLRKTHFPDAFVRNRDICTKDFHWWVMERSVEALGWFGDRSTVPALTWIRDHSQKLIDRQSAKIAHVLSEPGTYLEGPPRDVPE